MQWTTARKERPFADGLVNASNPTLSAHPCSVPVRKGCANNGRRRHSDLIPFHARAQMLPFETDVSRTFGGLGSRPYAAKRRRQPKMSPLSVLFEPEGFYQQRERRRGMAAAWVVEVVTGKRRAPVAQHAGDYASGADASPSRLSSPANRASDQLALPADDQVEELVERYPFFVTALYPRCEKVVETIAEGRANLCGHCASPTAWSRRRRRWTRRSSDSPRSSMRSICRSRSARRSTLRYAAP